MEWLNYNLLSRCRDEAVRTVAQTRLLFTTRIEEPALYKMHNMRGESVDVG